MSNNKIIKKIQDGLYVDEELQEFLKINNVFVLSNTMKEIVNLYITYSYPSTSFETIPFS